MASAKKTASKSGVSKTATKAKTKKKAAVQSKSSLAAKGNTSGKPRSVSKSRKTTPKTEASKALARPNRSPQAIPGRLALVCFLALYCALAVIVLFRLGPLGSFLYGLLSLGAGSFASVILIGLLVWGIWYIWNKGEKRVPGRFWLGTLLAAISWMTLAALAQTPSASPWAALEKLNGSVYSILAGLSFTDCGYLGAFAAGMLTSLVSLPGAWLAALTLLGMALLLLGWPWWKALYYRIREYADLRALPKPVQEESLPDSLDAGFEDLLISTPQESQKAPASKAREKVSSLLEKNWTFPKEDLPEIQEASWDLPEPEPAAKPRKEPVIKEAAAALPAEEAAVSRQEFLPVPALSYENYQLPDISLLNDPVRKGKNSKNTQMARDSGQKLISILEQFGVAAELAEIHIGPSVTKFEITLGQGVRVNTITNLQNDIKMALAATDIRIEAPIPGKSAVGIEVPNVEKSEVGMKELMQTLPAAMARQPLVFCLGKDLLGDNVYGRLDTMPHLLIAGATGSGKSVCVNSIISSILLRTRPDEVKLVLVDPKKVEFTPYNGVPHLLAPVITDGEMANKALKVVVEMMDRRYDLFEEACVRNINSYNAFVEKNPDDPRFKRLPRLVVIIDELADLMLVAAKEVEQSIQRITQLARAAGIHLIVATQRPSVNVITGVIKANIPSRIAFAVSSAVDSRTILDQTGAEKLLGYGDMLFLDNGDSAPRRIQGVFIKDEEVNQICEYVKGQAAPAYDDAFILLKDLQSQGGTVSAEAADPLYDQIKHFVITSRKASTSLIQRRFSIGYARAARVMDALEQNGVIGPANGAKPRDILVTLAGTEDEDVPLDLDL